MKKAEKDNPVKTIPEGAYEAGKTNTSFKHNKQDVNDITTDIQSNGYPVPNRKDGK